MKVSDVVAALETLAPPQLAAEWDNVGLLIGDGSAAVKRLLLCIDLTEDVLAEALRQRAGMVMAYHPVIFKPVSRITADDAPIAWASARAGVAVYSAHTALDAAPGGTNDVLADVLGLTNRRPLQRSVLGGRCKIVAFVPPEELSAVAEAAFAAGAGRIGNYYDCAFFVHGIGAFCGGEGARPSVGAVGRHEVVEELRLEVIAPKAGAARVAEAMRAAHSYEQPAIDVYPLDDCPAGCGLGRIGSLPRPVTAGTLIGRIKKATGLKKLLVAAGRRRPPAGKGSRAVRLAACCAGSCGQLWREAADAGAKLYLTGEIRHHDALAAAAKGMTVVCLGHSNSERLAMPALSKRLRRACPGLNVVVSKRDVDPFEIV